MKPEEIRFGNFVTTKELGDNGYYVVDFITIKMSNNYTSIPLTEEWLLKFGFEKEDETKSKSHGSYFSMHILDYKYCLAFADFRNDWGFYQEYTDSPFEEDENKKYFVSCGIISVHQLQNLYFALIGTELTIN